MSIGRWIVSLVVLSVCGCAGESEVDVERDAAKISADNGTTGAIASSEPLGDKKRLQGVWVGTLAEAAGFSLNKYYEGSTLEFQGDLAILTTKSSSGADEVEEHLYELDETVSPKRMISYKANESKKNGKPAIYEIVGDELTVCYAGLNALGVPERVFVEAGEFDVEVEASLKSRLCLVRLDDRV